MFFIYLFFGIGVFATILGLIPAILEIYCFLYSLFANLETEKVNKKEIRKAKLDKKKEEKIEKLDPKKDLVEEIVIPEEEQAPVEEIKEETPVTEVVKETTTENETITTNTPVEE